MNASLRHLAILACLGTVAFAPSMGAAPASSVLLVKPRAGTPEAATHALLSAQGASETARIPSLDLRIVRVPATAAEAIRRKLAADPAIEYAEADHPAQLLAGPDDPFYTAGSQWYLGTIGAPTAWTLSTGSDAITVAVVDSGVLTTHPDLAGKVLPGYDFVNNDSDPTDDNGHGTAVAGLISAATNNATGMAGLSWNSLILPVKVTAANGSGSYSAIINGIVWAADRGARIINLSLGGTTSSRALQDAVNYAWGRNAVLIAAAGNNGNNLAFYPAACRNVVAVSATTSTDTRPSWSNYGSYVDISAPGASVLTLYGANSYAYWDGTSFSSPITSGVATLVAAANPGLSNASAVDLLLANADDIGAAGYDVYYGNGRVNAGRAVTAAWNAANLDQTAPVAAISSPADGATVSGVVNVAISGTDNVGVTRLELLVDGTLQFSSTNPSAVVPWDTTALLDGSHTLEVRAYDAVNLSGSKRITVQVRNSTVIDTTAPLAAITSPADGASIKGLKSVKIQIAASDNIAVTKVELYINGKLSGTSTTAPASFTWSTSKVAAGSHIIQAYAYDAAGNIGASPRITVTK